MLSSFCQDFISRLKQCKAADTVHRRLAHEEIEQRRKDADTRRNAEYDRRYQENMGSFKISSKDKRFTESKAYYDDLRRRVDNEMRKYVETL